MAIAKMLELLSNARTRLSHVVWDLPGHFTARLRAPCTWEAKGRVMRRLNERFGDSTGPQIDGVRVREADNVWALILPEPDQSGFFVYTESTSLEAAQALAETYAGLVRELQVA
jgi:mannose-1-phosphate guanylyltransferase/phosphomannomutase